VIPCSVVVGYQYFGGPSCHHLQQQDPVKHWYPTATLYGVTIQNTLKFFWVISRIECPLWLSSLHFFFQSVFKCQMSSFFFSLWSGVWSGTFLASGYSEVLLGYQPTWVVEQWTNQCFEDQLCPHPQSCDMAGDPVCCLYTCLSCMFVVAC
jgi:hypothetical protein